MPSSESLPLFRYHPDPIASGSITADSDTPCLGCNRIRGYIYTGSVYTDKNFILERHLCPWCIADGTAAKTFGASFNDTGVMQEDIPEDVRNEIEHRTPGFEGWQQEIWLGCCADGAEFLGRAGKLELERYFPQAIQSVKKYVRQELELSKDDAEELYSSLSKDDQPTAYVFRCLHCKKYLAYVDQT